MTFHTLFFLCYYLQIEIFLTELFFSLKIFYKWSTFMFFPFICFSFFTSSLYTCILCNLSISYLLIFSSASSLPLAEIFKNIHHSLFLSLYLCLHMRTCIHSLSLSLSQTTFCLLVSLSCLLSLSF